MRIADQVDRFAAGQQQIHAHGQVGAQLRIDFRIDFQDQHEPPIAAAPQGHSPRSRIFQFQLRQQAYQVRMRQMTIGDWLDAAALARQSPASRAPRQPQAVLIAPYLARGQHWLQRRFDQLVGQTPLPRKLVGQHILLHKQLCRIADVLPMTAPASAGTKVRAAWRDAVARSHLQCQAAREAGAAAAAGYFRRDDFPRYGIGHKDRLAAMEAQRLAAVPHIAQFQPDALRRCFLGSPPPRFALFSHSQTHNRCRLCPTRAG